MAASGQRIDGSCGVSRLQTIRHCVEYTIFLTVIGVVRRLPVRAAAAVSAGLAWTLLHVLPRRLSRFDVASANLRIAFGEDISAARIEQIIQGMWTHLFRMITEMVQLPGRFRLETCAEILQFEKRNECVQALLSDRPVLLLGGHFGNWEISLHTFGEFGFPMGVVARDLDNPWLQRWFLRYRQSSGHRVLSKSGAGPELAERLSAGGMVSLLCDQDAGRSGVFVDFFGRPASTFHRAAGAAVQRPDHRRRRLATSRGCSERSPLGSLLSDDRGHHRPAGFSIRECGRANHTALHSRT